MEIITNVPGITAAQTGPFQLGLLPLQRMRGSSGAPSTLPHSLRGPRGALSPRWASGETAEFSVVVWPLVRAGGGVHCAWTSGCSGHFMDKAAPIP